MRMKHTLGKCMMSTSAFLGFHLRKMAYCRPNAVLGEVGKRLFSFFYALLLIVKKVLRRSLI
jgi:hypothetical protein